MFDLAEDTTVSQGRMSYCCYHRCSSNVEMKM